MAFEIPDTVKTLNNTRLLHEWAGPFAGSTISAAKGVANAYIPAGARLKGLEVTLLVAGTPAKYWYQNGTADSDLIAMPTGGGGGGSLTVKDEGTTVEATATILNFTGNGVVASGASGTATINIPGGATISSTLIDLISGNYTITNIGQFTVKNGSDNTYFITFPDPNEYAIGDKITITNNDYANYYAAPIDQSTPAKAPLVQGVEYLIYDKSAFSLSDITGTVKNIPAGMTYVFERTRNGQAGGEYWMCHPTNTEPVYGLINLNNKSIPATTDLYIQSHGIYYIGRGSDGDKGGGKIVFPDPLQHLGKQVTLVGGETASVIDTDVYFPVFSNLYSVAFPNIINYLPAYATYVFVAVSYNDGGVDYATWILVSSTPALLPTIPINLVTLGSDYFITGGGVYLITAASNTYGITFVAPSYTAIGQRVTVYNLDTISLLIVTSGGTGVRPRSKGSFTNITSIAAGEVMEFINIGGSWSSLS